MAPHSRSPGDAAYRAARRALARQLHPDRGGDPDAFIAALAHLDSRRRATASAVEIRRTAAGRWQTLRRAWRRRRFIDL